MVRKKDDSAPEIKRTGSFCHNCGTATSFYLYNPDEFERGGKKEYFHFATCEMCGAPGVFLRTDLDEDPEPRFNRIFPESRNALSCSLPPSVERSYAEVLTCEEASAPLACVVMVGRTLEAACKEHFSTQKGITIFKGIQQLYEEGLISEQLKEWADELRVLRNIGAHAVTEDVSPVDAREAVNFLRAILENLYDLGPRFNEFKTRRNNLGPKDPPSA